MGQQWPSAIVQMLPKLHRLSFNLSALVHPVSIKWGVNMVRFVKVVAALALSVAVLFGCGGKSRAQQSAVTAIDIALEVDAIMIQHAQSDNARLLKDFPKGFTLDATHHPHISMLQQFVRTADLDKVYAAAGKVFAGEKTTSWKLKAFKYYYIPSPPVGLAGIVVEPTDDLHKLQQELIVAVTPFTVKTGTPAAFISTEDGRDIQADLIEYVNHFVKIAAGMSLIRTSQSVLAPSLIWRRCLQNRLMRSPSRQRERQFTSLVLLVRLARNSRPWT